jgi:lysozyme family protein
MAASDYDACLSRVLAHEGGYTNDPRDPGGPTNWGITLADAHLHWKPTATAADVKAMPVSVAKDIYRAKYWNALRCDDLPAGVDDTVFDYGVNSGIGRAGKVLRRVLGLPDDDWHVTSVVMIPLSRRDPAAVIKAINDERLKFLQHLSTWDHFGTGWAKRVAEVRAYSLALSAGVPPHGAPPVVVAANVGKGQVPKPNTAPVVKGGTAAVVASGGLFHWFGAHPALTVALLAAGVALVLFIVSRIHASHQAQQEAPTPGIVPVPAA